MSAQVFAPTVQHTPVLPASEPEAEGPPRCERHAGAGSGKRRDGQGRYHGDGTDSCTDCATLSRSHRRRRQRDRERELAARAGDPRPMELAAARQILEIARAEHDPEIRAQLYRVARAYRMRHAGDEHKQRMAVLKVLERNPAPLTLTELHQETLLTRELIQSFLDEWASAEVDLVFITTMGGKRKCGRRGTTLYYGLNR